MEWLALFGLFVWTLVQASRVSDLRDRLRRAETQLELLARRGAPEGAAAAVARTSVSGPSAAEAPPPSIAAPSPPRPAADAPPPVSPAPAPWTRYLEPDRASSAPDTPHAPAAPPSAARSASRPSVSLDRWIAENGLAWLGGGALALGAAFLVGYAAQQGLFTPLLRVIAGGVLGGVLLAVSEWIRRAEPGGRWSHPLAAAACAGAGAAALYAAVWAAHGLYALIPTPVAALLLAAISAGLLGLSLRHGQALAALAMFGAFAAPLATGADRWTFGALTLLLVAAITAGFAVARLRRWVAPAVITAIGGLGWAGLAVVEAGAWRAAGLILLTGAAAVAAFADRAAASGETRDWAQARRLVPGYAVAGGALLALALWAQSHQTEGGAAMLGVLALAAAAVALCRLPGLFLTIPAAAAAPAAAFDPVLGPLFARKTAAGLGWTPGWAVALALGAALAGRVRADPNADRVGAAGAALLLALFAWASTVVEPLAAWAVPAIGAAALLALAFTVSRREPAPASSQALDAWTGGAVAAALTACAAGFDARGEAIAYAAVALACAGAGVSVRWRAWPWAALLTAGVALAGLFQPAFFGPAATGGAPLWTSLGAPTTVAALLTASAVVLRRTNASHEQRQAMISAAAVAALLAVFLLLRRSADDGRALDGLTETGLQALALLAAGLVSARAGGGGRMAALRTHALLGAGGGWALLVVLIGWNPWWGVFRAPIVGPPLLDSIAVAALAPAVLLAAAAALLYRRVRAAGRTYAALSVGLAVLWAVLETRRLFHAPLLDEGAVVPLEGLLYGLILLAAPVGLLTAAGAGRLGVASEDFARAARGGSWAGLALALLFAWLLFNPWWGAAAAPYTAGWQPAATLAVLGACAALSAALARRTAPSPLATAATSSAVAFLFLIPTLAIRWTFHGLDQRFGLSNDSVESWSYSAAWAVFGLAILALGSARGGAVLRRAGLLVLLVAACKVFLFDMATLTGVLRAASFLGLGAVLMAGAVAARRLGVLPSGRARITETSLSS